MQAPPLAVAVLVKQVPRFDSLRLCANGRLAREGTELELNPYCRRAVSKGVELASESGGRCTVFTLGPPSAEDCLREAVACGADAGVLVTDPAFAGSDTLATAQALASALRRMGPFDLVLCGRNSVDADTAQMPAQLAQLLDLPMAAGVRSLTVLNRALRVRCEHDDGWLEASIRIPALLTCAERLTKPAKATPQQRAAVCPSHITRLDAAALGPGPWGQAGSMTTVGTVRRFDTTRLRRRFEGSLGAQVQRAISVLSSCGAFDPDPPPAADPVPAPLTGPAANPVGVLVEPDRDRMTRELLGAAARLAAARRSQVMALAPSPLDPAVAGSWGADVVVGIRGSHAVDAADSRYPEEEIAAVFAAWCADHSPWAILAPSTMWGREVAGRIAAQRRLGLVGDAIDILADHDGTLLCWKPAFGGELAAAVTCRSRTQMATVRSGVLPLLQPRSAVARRAEYPAPAPRHRIDIARRSRDDDLEALATATAVVCVGAGVPPDEYRLVDPLLRALGAELAATRKVTDLGWQPRSRQVGITGRSIAPRLLVTVGVRGAFNHMVGARRAKVILAINNDPIAPVFDAADAGIVADWRQAVPCLARAIAQRTSRRKSPDLANGPERSARAVNGTVKAPKQSSARGIRR